MSTRIIDLLAERKGENFRLHEHYLNPQMVKVLKTIGYDRVYTKAQGQYLYDQNGAEYLDLLSGFGVFAVGRNHPTVATALRDESGVSTVRRICRVLTELGLGYLRMSQPLSTLSGGEAQRLKLIRLLARPNPEPTVFLLDEPTIGLHSEDIARLLAALDRLLERGHTVVVVEHHPEVILNADYMIDLGPEGGDAGGRIVAEGPVLSLIEDSTLETHTLRYLRTVFASVREVRR